MLQDNYSSKKRFSKLSQAAFSGFCDTAKPHAANVKSRTGIDTTFSSRARINALCRAGNSYFPKTRNLAYALTRSAVVSVFSRSYCDTKNSDTVFREPASGWMDDVTLSNTSEASSTEIFFVATSSTSRLCISKNAEKLLLLASGCYYYF